MLVSLALDTVPDVAGYRAVHGLDPVLSAADVAEYMFQRQRARHGRDSLPPHWRRVVAVAAVIRDPAGVRCFAAVEDDEAALFAALLRQVPADCNGLVMADGGAGLAALRPRALRHALDLPPWPVWLRAADCMIDLCAHCGVDTPEGLDELGALIGLPRVFAATEGAAWSRWLAGDQARVRAQCLARAVGAFRLHLRTQVVSGARAPAACLGEEALLRAALATEADVPWGAAGP